MAAFIADNLITAGLICWTLPLQCNMFDCSGRTAATCHLATIKTPHGVGYIGMLRSLPAGTDSLGAENEATVGIALPGEAPHGQVAPLQQRHLARSAALQA